MNGYFVLLDYRNEDILDVKFESTCRPNVIVEGDAGVYKWPYLGSSFLQEVELDERFKPEKQM